MGGDKPKIDACFSPFLYPVYKEDDAIVVIIDIFRATTAICIAFEYGAEKIIPVATIEEALAWKKKGMLAGAEREAVKVDGFDFGNSPFDYNGEHVRGKSIVLTTTNGTQAIEAAKDAHKVVVGSFLNIKALCEFLISEKRNILLLCSGWKNKFNLEDALFAGAVTHEIDAATRDFDFGDACVGLKYLYQMARKDPNKFLAHSSHKERLVELNLKRDIKFCLTPDQTDAIPILENGVLVKLRR